MPANLTPDYLAAEARFRAARTNEEKLAALEEMLATVPKHKGTEKLQADIKRRISKLREKHPRKGPEKPRTSREGIGSIVLLGPAGSGKTSLIRALASSGDFDQDADSPAPSECLVEYEDVRIQLLEDQSGYAGASTAVVLDLSDDSLLDQFEDIRASLGEQGVSLIIGTKLDLPDAAENLDALTDAYGDEFTVQPVSVETGEGLEDLRIRLFDSLGLIRVYAKDGDIPHLIERDATLVDFASAVSEEHARNLKHARLWRRDEFDGARISWDFVLEDGDVVELHL